MTQNRQKNQPSSTLGLSNGLLLEQLLAWYDLHRRTLPWRAASGQSADSYHVLVSELMLQQTTVATVRNRYGPFIQRFPTIDALARSTEDEVLHEWQGLGYYRRARALHACAKAVVTDHVGQLPKDVDTLITLPGIGAYTAKALAAIAHEQPVLPVDGNVMRVLARLFAVETPLPKAAGTLQALALDFEPCPRPSDTAQAFMDLGATVCRPGRPDCASCPWSSDCAAHDAGIAADLPKREAKRPKPVRRGVAFLLKRPDGAVLFRKRPDQGLLGGLHELPSTPWEPRPLDRRQALKEAPCPADWRFHDQTIRHVFTHFVLELDLAEATIDANILKNRKDQPKSETAFWQRPDEFDQLALPTVMKKLLRLTEGL